MIFWAIAGLAVLTALASLWRATRVGNSNHADPQSVYRSQLEELERDVARSVVTDEEARRLRAEIARRLLALEGQETAELTASRKSGLLMGLVSVTVIAAALATYLTIGQPGYPDLPLKERLAVLETLSKNRPSQAEAEASTPPAPSTLTEESEALLVQLREVIKTRPDDLEGLRLLARTEAGAGEFQAAQRAQARIIDLRGNAVTAEEIAALGELMVLAAGGYVSPEAETQFRRALSLSPENGTARYYLGSMFVQGGRADRAFIVWRELLADSPPDAPWLPAIYAQIEEVSQLAGDFTPLSELPQPIGPTAADIAAAGDLTDGERLQMIQGMVAQLSERLATQGGSSNDWARLITSLAVLGETERAQSIFEEALSVFVANEDALTRIRSAGEAAGLTAP